MKRRSNHAGSPKLTVRLWRSLRLRQPRRPERPRIWGPGLTGSAWMQDIDKIARLAERLGAWEPHVGSLYLRVFLHLLCWTGWNGEIVAQLRRSDLYLEPERLVGLLAELGLPSSVKLIWRHGVICWNLGTELRPIPIARSLRTVLDAYLQPGGPWEVARSRWGRVLAPLDSLLFPSPAHPDLAVDLHALQAWFDDAKQEALANTRGIDLWSHPFRTCQLTRQLELQQLCDELGGEAYLTLAYLLGRRIRPHQRPSPEGVFRFATYPEISRETITLWLRSSDPSHRDFAVSHLVPKLQTNDGNATA